MDYSHVFSSPFGMWSIGPLVALHPWLPKVSGSACADPLHQHCKRIITESEFVLFHGTKEGDITKLILQVGTLWCAYHWVR